MSVAQRFQEVREALRVSQKDFARLLGVNQSAIAHLESGRNQPSGGTVELLAARFGVLSRWLLEGKGPAWAKRWQVRAQKLGSTVAWYRVLVKRDVVAVAKAIDVDPLEIRLVEEGRMLPSPELLELLEEELDIPAGHIEETAKQFERDEEDRDRFAKEAAAEYGRGRLPIVGTIAAGRPLEAIEVRETLDITELLLGQEPREKFFALRVRGDSMEADGIRDGDIVIVERRAEPKSGEVVVALLRHSEATLKRFRRVGKKIRLHAGDSGGQDFDERDVEFQGVAVGLIRGWRAKR